MHCGTPFCNIACLRVSQVIGKCSIRLQVHAPPYVRSQLGKFDVVEQVDIDRKKQNKTEKRRPSVPKQRVHEYEQRSSNWHGNLLKEWGLDLLAYTALLQ